MSCEGNTKYKEGGGGFELVTSLKVMILHKLWSKFILGDCTSQSRNNNKE